MTLGEFNQLNTEQAQESLAKCCTSERWIHIMTRARPFSSHTEMQKLALSIWYDLEEKDYLQAFEGHPKIGDINSLRKKYANTQTLASHEQASVAQADENTLSLLARANDEYLKKYGFIFIVYATGKSAAQMLSILKNRLLNDRMTEIKNAAIEQSKITALRINKLLGLTE